MNHSVEKLILNFIERETIVTSKSIGNLLHIPSHLASVKLLQLFKERKVKRFQMSKSGAQSPRLTKTISGNKAKVYFDGFSRGCEKKSFYYYYLDDMKVSEIIKIRLKLSPIMPVYKRRALTHYLRRCLPPELFRLVYEFYKCPTDGSYRSRWHHKQLFFGKT